MTQLQHRCDWASAYRDFYVTITLQHNVVQFEITVDYALGMKEEQADGNFRGIEPKPASTSN